ncbi:hypothetical protein JCM3765_002038 [Sporobolomyces pararoseus]
MGVFKKFFSTQTKSSSESDLNKRSSSSPPRHHSTLDSNRSFTPSVQPLWALATEPELPRSRYNHHTYSGGETGQTARRFGPRDPRPHPSTVNEDQYGQLLSSRVQQLGLEDQRGSVPVHGRQERPSASPPTLSNRPSQPHPSYLSHQTTYPPSAAAPTSNSFLSYPPYQIDKPLPSPSHSPDRPQPRPIPPPIPPLPTTSSRRFTPSSTPFHSPAKSATSSVPPRISTNTSTQTKPSAIPSPRRKKSPQVVIEISSSSSSSSTAESTDYEEEQGDSSIEIETTPSSSPSATSRQRRRTPSPVKAKTLQTPPSTRRITPALSTSPKKQTTPASLRSPSKRSSPSKSNLSTPTAHHGSGGKTPSSRSNRSSASPSPSPSPAKSKSSPIPKVQCHGLTSSGKQCTRLTTPPVPSRAPKDEDAEDDLLEEAEDEGGEPVYCHQHTKTSLVQTGCFVKSKVAPHGEGAVRGKTERSREVWINYNDWILPDLPLQTQSLLRHYLAKPVSEKDREGFIYIHELIDKNHPPNLSSTASSDRTYLKLGRTIHPVLRLTQWRSSCPSLDPIVRDILPRRQQPQLFTGGSLNPQTNFAESGTKNHFRWERLCLVEIAGRCKALYKSESEDGEGEREKEKCKDCGKKHLECFRVGRDAFSSGIDGNEGGWVVEIVERWERWCRDVLG